MKLNINLNRSGRLGGSGILKPDPGSPWLPGLAYLMSEAGNLVDYLEFEAVHDTSEVYALMCDELPDSSSSIKKVYSIIRVHQMSTSHGSRYDKLAYTIEYSEVVYPGQAGVDGLPASEYQMTANVLVAGVNQIPAAARFVPDFESWGYKPSAEQYPNDRVATWQPDIGSANPGDMEYGPILWTRSATGKTIVDQIFATRCPLLHSLRADATLTLMSPRITGSMSDGSLQVSMVSGWCTPVAVSQDANTLYWLCRVRELNSSETKLAFVGPSSDSDPLESLANAFIIDCGPVMHVSP